MVRIIIVNLLVAFAIFPLIIFLKDLVFIKDLRYFVYNYGYDKDNFYDYVRLFVDEYIFREIMFLSSIFLIILILLPFQFIKSYYYNKNGNGLKLWKKCLMFFGMITFVFAFLFRPPMTEMQERIVLFGSLFAIAIVFTLLLYLTVDRYVERSRLK